MLKPKSALFIAASHETLGIDIVKAIYDMQALKLNKINLHILLDI